MGPSLTSLKVKEKDTKYAYGTYGRVTKTTYVNGTFDQVDYNDIERQITSTNKKGNTTSAQYSIYDQTLQETDALNRQKSYAYNDNDQVTSVKMSTMEFKYTYYLRGTLFIAGSL